MKLQSNSLLTALSNDELNVLTTEIKETLASSLSKEKKKIFSSAQLWDIYRRRKNTFGKRVY